MVATSDYRSKSVDETAIEIENSYGLQAERCANNAPFICYQQTASIWRIMQGCCNSWTCPRCGYIRAREEYGKMVNGAKVLSDTGQDLYFVTITCLGGDMTPQEAETGYAKWTNRLLSTMRADAKKRGVEWSYVQVTEYQKRGVPHSHFITTYCPSDAILIVKGEVRPDGITAKHDCLYSKWFQDKNVSAGLGPMCDISLIKSAVGVATYVSKYLFKDAVFTSWPPGWKRIRYAQSWPKLPDVRSGNDAFPVITRADWSRVRSIKKLRADDFTAYLACQEHGAIRAILNETKSP